MGAVKKLCKHKVLGKTRCKKCLTERLRKYEFKNKDKRSGYFKKWYVENKEEYNLKRAEKRKLKILLLKRPATILRTSVNKIKPRVDKTIK